MGSYVICLSPCTHCVSSLFFIVLSQSIITESENSWGWKSALEIAWSKSPAPRTIRVFFQDCIPLGFGYFKDNNSTTPSGYPFYVWPLRQEKGFLSIKAFPASQFMSGASYHVMRHYWGVWHSPLHNQPPLRYWNTFLRYNPLPKPLFSWLRRVSTLSL